MCFIQEKIKINCQSTIFCFETNTDVRRWLLAAKRAKNYSAIVIKTFDFLLMKFESSKRFKDLVLVVLEIAAQEPEMVLHLPSLIAMACFFILTYFKVIKKTGLLSKHG